MTEQEEQWRDFARSYAGMTSDERREIETKLSPAQLQYVGALLAERLAGSIQFVDFKAREHPRSSTSMSRSTHESVAQVVDRLNQWIRENRVEVINIETIILPNIHNTGVNSEASRIRNYANYAWSSLHQVLRVWFRMPPDHVETPSESGG
ncbi:MAG: hypothetical protein AAGD38_13460 [Acidobacteriota bacterium]